MNITLLPEENYSDVMNQQVLPALAEICESDTFERIPGQPIYYELYRPAGYKAWIAISHGFVESGYKYAELIWYFTQNGYAVAIPDHRGHGRSYRGVEEKWLTHVDSFSDYAEDYACFLRRVVAPAAGEKPVYLMGHSMGGAIAALTLMRHPNLPVKKLVLSSPMIAPQTRGVPKLLTYGITRFFILTGREKECLFNQQIFTGRENFDSDWCCATSYARYCWYLDVQREHEEFQNNAATYRWLEESLLVSRTLLKQSNCDKLKLPVLLLQAGQDTMVENGAQNQFVQKLPDCRLVQFPTAKHEIFRSENKIVGEFVESVLDFLKK